MLSIQIKTKSKFPTGKHPSGFLLAPWQSAQQLPVFNDTGAFLF